MSIFTSLVTETLPVPRDEAQSVTIRRLSPAALRRASEAAQLAAVEAARRMREAMGPALAETLDRVTPGQMAEAKAADPLLAYDRIALMEAGIVSWTYDRPVTAETLADLDDDAQDWLAGAILRLSKPSLYRTEAEQEDARKNG